MGRRHRRAEDNEPEGRRVSQGKSKIMAKHMDKAAQGPRGRKENGSDPFLKSASPCRVRPTEVVSAQGAQKTDSQRARAQKENAFDLFSKSVSPFRVSPTVGVRAIAVRY